MAKGTTQAKKRRKPGSSAKKKQRARGAVGAARRSPEPAQSIPTRSHSIAPKRRPAPAAVESIARQLEQELKNARKKLQHTIEELKASHEKVTSMNEELQSTNEELETSKEELQSLNEELSTVNNQLQEKLDEIEAANDDMANVLTSADIATLYLAADHTIRRFSTPANRVFRLISADIGRPIEDIRSRIDDPALPGDVDAVLRTLTPREQKVRTDDGYWYLRRINPYRTADNRIEGVVVSYTEITALQRVEEDLRELTDQFELRVAECSARLQAERNFVAAVFETVAALVVVLDRDGRVVRWNKACEQATGYRAEEMSEPAAWERLLLPEEKDEVQCVFEELRAGHCPNRHENHWRHRDGSRLLIAWSNTCLRDSGGEVEYIIGTGIDVTQQRRSEGEARQRQAELAHLHRVYTAGEFAAVMAHELNQPLTAISGYSEAGLQLLRCGQPEPEAIIDKLEQIALQAQRAGQTIRELHRFLTRDEPQERHPVKLNELIYDVARLLTPEARASGVRIVPALSTEPLTILASDVQIEHVLVNLVQNAIEAIRAAGKPGGTITVRTAAEPEGMARVIVQDDGPGFNGEPPERLFERFYTTKPHGLGMGLVICRTIIRAHDGKIWAERPAEGGAAFHFTVPRQP